MNKAMYRLKDAKVKHVAFCKKGAIPDAVYALVKSAPVADGEETFVKEYTFAKVDKAKRQVFGYFFVPEKADLQKDIIGSDEVEKAVHSLMKNLAHGTADGTGASDSHLTIGGGYPIEVAVDRDGTLGKAAGVEGIPGAAWIGMQVTDEAIWEKIEKGEYTSFSPGGTVKRDPIAEPIAKMVEPVTSSNEPEAGLDEPQAASSLAKLIKTIQSGFEKLVDLAKGDGDALTYNDAQALRNVKDQIWKKQWQLEDSITSILGDDTVEDKVGMIATSIDQYKTDLLGLIAQLEAIRNKNKPQQTNKSIEPPEEGETMTREELDQLSKSITDGVNDNITKQYGEKLAKLDKIDLIETRLDALEKAQKGETEESPIALLKKDVGTALGSLNDIAKRLDTLEKKIGRAHV